MCGKPGRSGAKPKYPFRDMKPGQQRVVSGNVPSIRARLSQIKKAVGAVFTTETVECYLIVRRVR